MTDIAQDEAADRGYPPSRYMRQRRPHLFSDSQKVTEVGLSREVLSHHLETLTSQKGETEFEELARRLAERFIAPNLRPQTGPTGGGDGKTDAETFPVTRAIAQRWFLHDVAVASERMAFAFSAKKKWREKVKSDVKEIAGTGRDYSRIYFITNQFVSAKNSATLQDELEKEHGIPVTILDRTWILNSILERDSLDIAKECLGVGEAHAAVVVGPRDLKRQAELEKLDKAINDGTEYNGRPGRLADDMLRTAMLARGLERSRYEIDGRFERAVRAARDNELSAQELAAVYNWAWTSFFWFDDARKLNELYDNVERIAIQSRDADELDHLSNLIPLFVTAVGHGMLSPEEAAIERRRAALVDALEAAKNESSRPNNALHAHALLLLLKITTYAAKHDAAELDDIWIEFYTVFEQAKGLGTFPFEQMADVLTQFGEFIPESEAFDHLYELLTDALAERRSEAEAAQRNSDRGYQKLVKDLPYDAIRWFGRAVGLLVKAEYEEELVRALIGCSIAYQKAGLFWAARNYALAASTQAFGAFKRSHKVEDINPAVLSQWFDCELQIGRVPYALSAFELGAMIRNERSRTERQKEFAQELHNNQGHALAALMVRTEHSELRRLKSLPAILDKFGLYQARATILYLMGGYQALLVDESIPKDESAEDVEKLFNALASASDQAHLPKVDYLLADHAELHSRVLGCDLTVDCENNLTSISVGEAVLGSLEALLATSLSLRTIPQLDQLKIRVRAQENAPITPSLKFVEENGSTIVEITHKSQLRYQTRDELIAFTRWLQEATMSVFVRFAVPEDLDDWGETVLGNESGFSRSLTFSNVPTMTDLIFGSRTRISIDNWAEDGFADQEITRATAWQPTAKPNENAKKNKPGRGVGHPPEGIFNLENLKHSDYKIVSPIDGRKWDEAKWCAAFFMTSPGSTMTPVLGLAFQNRDPAKAIFQGLRERFGERDTKNDLRIAIITGINISNPHAYAVIVGPNMDNIPTTANITAFLSRIQIMQPRNSRNLDLFLSEYRRLNRYELVAAHITDDQSPPEPLLDLAIGKVDLVVRPAWTIPENDPDASALNFDDPPVIPMDQINAPVLKALEQMARFRRK
jgi:hypothetical protein